MSRIATLRPNLSEIQPKIRTNPIAPNAESELIHDSSSSVILPCFSGEWSDLKSSRLGPVKPMTIPNMKAVS